MLQGIPSIMTARGAGGSTLLSGLQVYYKLEDLTDSSGGALTLTNNNGVTFVAGKVNNAAHFTDTSTQFLSHVDATGYQPGTGDWSISAWFNLTSGKTSNCLLEYGKVAATHAAGYNLRTSNTNILGTISDGTNLAFKINTATINDGAWHFVIVTFARGGNMSMYIDNAAAQTASIAAVTGSVNDNSAVGLTIGKDDSGDYWDNLIDEVGMWNRVLTSTEISTLWNSGNGTTYPF